MGPEEENLSLEGGKPGMAPTEGHLSWMWKHRGRLTTCRASVLGEGTAEAMPGTYASGHWMDRSDAAPLQRQKEGA